MTGVNSLRSAAAPATLGHPHAGDPGSIVPPSVRPVGERLAKAPSAEFPDLPAMHADALPNGPQRRGTRAGPSVLDVQLQQRGVQPPTRRNSPGHPLGSLRFEALLDRETNSVARAGNLVAPLFNGVESFAFRWHLLENATESIHLQTFILSDDKTSAKTAELLARKAQEGVKVRLLLDGVGSNRRSRGMLKMMREAGVEVRIHPIFPRSNPLSINNRRHEKILVVDGEAAITGGMNIADEYAFGGKDKRLESRNGAEAWRDTDVYIKGPSVHDLQATFLLNWAELGDTPSNEELPRLYPKLSVAPNGSTARIVQHRPVEERDQHTRDLYFYTILSAERDIKIENAYFVPPPLIRQALIDAAKRGVRVQIFTNSPASSDMRINVAAARHFYDELMAAGAIIYEKTGGTLHGKTMTVDGEYSIIGTKNLNGRSSGIDSEVVVAVHSRNVAADLEKAFYLGLWEAEQFTSRDLERLGMWQKVKNWAAAKMQWTI